MPVDPSSVPDFDDLPKVKDMPQGCAWGIFDQDGKKDLVGTLNFLTPEIVRSAAGEVKDGMSISLNWPLNGLSKLGVPGRNPTKHNVLYLPESMAGGVPPTRHQNLSAETTAQNTQPTLDHWHEHGGLAARGVLLDYKRYAEETGLSFHAWGGDRLTVEQLEACARHFGVEFRYGDVLLVRTGATDVIAALTPEDLQMMQAQRMSGLHGCVETARWIWNKRFAAIASDSMALEAFPPLKADGTDGGLEDLFLHHYMLSLFGMSIGELWDLSKLSECCAKRKRYSFMLTSIPLNHPCLIGSPPNAMAIL
ncbi:hypothetical protein ACCO45_012086 [Purpureocillium lilacinum]|uniref:Uncharacterized protein n=1 Tax=Purpureocillium lilacinum TaxID=33203 RepID=A0ACC4DCR0_PURLI